VSKTSRIASTQRRGALPVGFIAGRVVRTSRPGAEIVSVDPGATSRVVGRFGVLPDAVDEAVAAARAAFPGWSRRDGRARARVLRRFARLVAEHAEGLARLLTREMGKPLWEARQEIAQVVRKVDVSLGPGLERVRPFAAADGGRCRFRPRGTLAVLGPFNFPVHLPNGHIVPALATGNTVVFKPSETTPAIALRYARLLNQAGCPRGVFNVVIGGGEIGHRLAVHSAVDGVLFTGSAEVGRMLGRHVGRQPGKLLALEMGGKNAAVVLDDADLEIAVQECLLGAFLTTGQRCTATSRIIVTRSVADRFIDALVAAARQLTVGYGLDRGVFMGPLATEAGVATFEKAQRDARREGAEVLLAGGRTTRRRPGFYVTPGIHRVRTVRSRSRYQRDEVFGPDVAVYVVNDTDEAVERADDSDYGLALSVFTRRRRNLEPFFERCRVGVLNWNRSTVGASSQLPFGGQRASGNDRPTALFAADYCTYPVAMLGSPAHASAVIPPGFPPVVVDP
jgi:succinylglutamic semialdehyde dehydrogenase